MEWEGPAESEEGSQSPTLHQERVRRVKIAGGGLCRGLRNQQNLRSTFG